MRFREIRGGFQVPVSNEEHRLLERIEETGMIERSQLDERELELARIMVSRGILDRLKQEGSTTHYVINNLEDIWRT